MKLYQNFESLPGKKGYGINTIDNKEAISKIIKEMDWSKVAFKSTNSALNLRTSLIEKEIKERLKKA